MTTVLTLYLIVSLSHILEREHVYSNIWENIYIESQDHYSLVKIGVATFREMKLHRMLLFVTGNRL